MHFSQEHFIQELTRHGIKKAIIKQIAADSSKSPLTWAFTISAGEIALANNSDHSFRVFQNSIALCKARGCPLNPSDYLVLFYASLLHDVAKSKEKEIKDEIREVLAKRCALFAPEQADHGVRSAYYVSVRREESRLHLYGLKGLNCRLVCNIIAFHASGRIHTTLLGDHGPTLREVLFCNLFRLADVADAAHYRVEAALTVKGDYLSEKVKARAQVQNIGIHKDHIVWIVKRATSEIKEAARMANEELLPVSVLLGALGLPSCIKLTTKRAKKSHASPTPRFSHNGLAAVNMAAQCQRSGPPLVLCAPNLPKLYEVIVSAYHPIRVASGLGYDNYSGPVYLEVSDAGADRADETRIRSDVGIDMNQVLAHVHPWLDHRPEASKNFYFGYTHGQRIFSYRYPRTAEEIGQPIHTWTGDIDQYSYARSILENEGQSARRAVVVISHPCIDSSQGYKHHHDDAPPSMIAIHFQIEAENRLSGFAFLRSQELSVFSVLNYLEIKSLLFRLRTELLPKNPDLVIGRIAMMSSLAYFDPTTALLDKPELCKAPDAKFVSYARGIADPGTREELKGLLRQYAGRNYLRIATDWCETLATELEKAGQYISLAKQASALCDGLRCLDEERKAHLLGGTKLLDRKQELVEAFIKGMDAIT